MNSFGKVVIVVCAFSFFIFFNIKTSVSHDNKSNKNKLHQYFSVLNNNKGIDKTSVFNHERFVKDSLSDIKNNSSNIRFVEVSEFSDSISIRVIVSNEVSHNYYVKFNNKKSKHIGTTYISTKRANSLVKNDFKKIISTLEFNLANKSLFKPGGAINDYVVKDIEECNVFYINGGEYLNDKIFNLRKTKYSFEYNQGYNDSIYLVEHLLNNYSFEKFENLWKNDFSNIENIYGKSLLEIRREYKI